MRWARPWWRPTGLRSAKRRPAVFDWIDDEKETRRARLRVVGPCYGRSFARLNHDVVDVRRRVCSREGAGARRGGSLGDNRPGCSTLLRTQPFRPCRACRSSVLFDRKRTALRHAQGERFEIAPSALVEPVLEELRRDRAVQCDAERQGGLVERHLD